MMSSLGYPEDERQFQSNNAARAASRLPDLNLNQKKQFSRSHKHHASRVRANTRGYVQEMAVHTSHSLSQKSLGPKSPSTRSMGQRSQSTASLQGHRGGLPSLDEVSPPSRLMIRTNSTGQVHTAAPASPVSVFTKGKSPTAFASHGNALASSPANAMIQTKGLAHSASAPSFGGQHKRKDNSEIFLSQPLRLTVLERDSFAQMPKRVLNRTRVGKPEQVDNGSRRKTQRLISDWAMRAESCRRSGRHAAEILACWSMGVLHDNIAEHLKAVGAYINAAVLLQRQHKRQQAASAQRGAQRGAAPMLQADGEEDFDRVMSQIRGEEILQESMPQESAKERDTRLKEDAVMISRCPITLPIVYNAIGISLHTAGPQYFEKALQFHRLHLENTEKQDLPGTFAACSNIGLVFMALDNAEDASQYHLSAVQIATRLRDPVKQRLAIGNLGVCRHAQGDFTLAAECLEVQMASGNSTNNQLQSSSALGNIAMERGEQDKAIGYYDKAYHLAREVRDDASLQKASTNLGISIGKAKLEEHMRAAAAYFNINNPQDS